MTKVSYVLAVALCACASVAFAQAGKQPVSQGVASVQKNVARDPDNKGLQNALQRVEANEKKVAAKRVAAKEHHRHDGDNDKKGKSGHHEKGGRHGMDRRHDKSEHHERGEHAEKMEHPEAMERPERGEHPGK